MTIDPFSLSQIPRATMNFHRPVMSSLRWRRGASRQFFYVWRAGCWCCGFRFSAGIATNLWSVLWMTPPSNVHHLWWVVRLLSSRYDDMVMFTKMGVPQAIIHFDGIFHCKPSSYWCTPIVGMWSCFRPAASHVTNASPITELNVAQIQTFNGQVGMLNITHFWLKIGLSWWFVDLLTSFSFQWGKSQWSAQKNSTSTCDGFNMFQSMKLCVASGFSTFHAGKVGMWKSSSQIQWPF